jgi:hypothetical protein
MDRFDICDAHYVFATLWHSGQGSKVYGYFGRLARMGYKPGLCAAQGKLNSEGSRAAYRSLCLAHGC